jgi:antibiotic biosynthesis monooxygenase (ABM) superfamily enzyme
MKKSTPAMHDQPVTTIICQRPRKGEVARYETWLKKIIPAAKRFEGHGGVNIIRPHYPDETYAVILHFASTQKLQSWLSSSERKALVDEILPYLHREEEIEIHSGLEFWFTPQIMRQPPRYKQFLLTLSAIYPLTVLVPLMLEPLLKLPLFQLMLIGKLVVATVIVGLMTYVIMPRYTKLVSRWLWADKV